MSEKQTAGRSKPAIKKLPSFLIRDLEHKNKARELAGLSLIRIKVRRCIACGARFESIGNRGCGCISRNTPSVGGRDIL